MARRRRIRRAGSEHLAAGEERFRSLSAASPIGIFQTDAAGRRLYANARWEELGITSEEGVDGDWGRTIHPDDRTEALRQWREALAEGRGISLEFRFLTTACEIRWLHVCTTPILSRDGCVTGYVGTFEDVTSRREVEKALRKTNDTLQALVDASPLAIVTFDVRGTVSMLNAAAERMFGWSREEVLGRFVPNLGEARFRAATRDVVERGPVSGLEIRLPRKDGTEIDVSVSMAPVSDGRGGVQGVVCLVEDITKRKRAEIELAAARDRALELVRLKSQFLANMSHEIRTPMSAILGMTDMALETTLSDEQRDYLETVKSSSVSLLELLNDILDLSKIEAGRLELASIPFSLRGMLDETLRTLALRAQQKELELQGEVARDVPDAVVGDPRRLRQVLLNLVGNALKFTERGEVVVRARCESVGADRVRVHFAVSDTGIGIPADQQGLIFAPFVQADGSMTRQHGGTGLGLGIASELVSLMDGRLWVESSVGVGSTFHFTASLAVRGEGRTRPARKIEHTMGTPLRVLLAEDNAVNRKVVIRMLERRGHRVEAVADGRQALAALARAHFDLVLMDVQMPGMDGLETTARVRVHEAGTGRHVPIVALTAHAMEGDRERCLAAGMDGYVSKPIDAAELAEAIARLVPVACPAAIEVQSAFDLAGMLVRAGGDGSLLEDVLAMFREETPRLLSEIDASVQRRDAEGVERTAHSLRGGLATLGADVAARAAGCLEAMGRSGELHEVERAWTALQSEMRRLEQELASRPRRSLQPRQEKSA
jgi:PAS domain S-box-containing protein